MWGVEIKMLIVFIVSVIFTVIGVGFYGGFVISEGKDERRQAILGKSSQIVFPVILIGFVFLILYTRLTSPNVEQIEIIIHLWMALIWLISSVSIFILKKQS